VPMARTTSVTPMILKGELPGTLTARWRLHVEEASSHISFCGSV
jgi:hypothetical protein